jgi:hypothetical protein
MARLGGNNDTITRLSCLDARRVAMTLAGLRDASIEQVLPTAGYEMEGICTDRSAPAGKALRLIERAFGRRWHDCPRRRTDSACASRGRRYIILMLRAAESESSGYLILRVDSTPGDSLHRNWRITSMFSRARVHSGASSSVGSVGQQLSMHDCRGFSAQQQNHHRSAPMCQLGRHGPVPR